ncbi:hypothetical protein [Gryllotalpicola koreensis]|uniref:Uncharacterized protein n=1 Tax=Gryllotalpicola koreensis TaxID=993086 RepID=A0ABP8A6I9_9MICO
MIDPAKLIAYVTAHPTNRRSYCLSYWYDAAKAAGMPAYPANLPTAQAAMDATPGITQTPVRNGFAWFTEKNGAGDIVAVIDGQVYATDAPTWEHVGATTIAARLASLQGLHGAGNVTFAGYSANLLGTPVDNQTATQEDDMPTIDELASSDKLLTAIATAVQAHKVNDSAGSEANILAFLFRSQQQQSAQLAGLTAAVAQLAKGQGGDPATIQKAVEDGVQGALDNLKVTVSQ